MSYKARSYLIDTIVRGKPIPKLYIRVASNPKTKRVIREVVDGQQRLKKPIIARTTVRHIGNRLLATCLDLIMPFQIRGDVQNGRYITGTWNQSERHYFGAFQMIASPNGKEMAGASVGFSRDGRVLPGNWKWTRPKDSAHHYHD